MAAVLARTMPAAAPRVRRVPIPSRIAARPLPWLMLLAAVLRVWAALTPGFHHPDAIYQYLEPAHRLLTGEGVVTWEWRLGIRSWLLPALLALPLGLGEAIDPTGPLPMLLPRLATAGASLAIVWAGWTIGRRQDAVTGALAAFVAATWFETVFFAAETLAEPLATAALLPAIALLTASRPMARDAVLAGALIGFAALARPHYGPAAAAAVLVAWWPGFRPDRRDLVRWSWLIAGATLSAAASALVDAANGLTPFAWIAANVDQNIVHGVAARYGTFPALSYVAWFLELWGVWTIPIAIGVIAGWRRCPALLAAAAVTLVVHSLIPHKEYRFVALASAALVVLAAIGWGVILGHVRARWGRRMAGHAAIAVFATWGLASVILAERPIAPNQSRASLAGATLFAGLRADPDVCGIALVQPASFADVPGMVALRRHVPMSVFWSDPETRQSGWGLAMRETAGFNRIVTIRSASAPMPSSLGPYRTQTCTPTDAGSMCVLARPGPCSGGAASRFAINRVMIRRGL